MTATQTFTVTTSLKVLAENVEGFLKLTLVGYVNEDFDFQKGLALVQQLLQKDTASKAVLFDLGELQGINSVGVRAWLLFIERIQAMKPAFFYRINELIIEQASVVPNLLGKRGTKVLMCDLPYTCDSCRIRVTKVVRTKQIAKDGAQYVLPQFPCERCGKVMEFDAMEKEYFNFLKYTED